MQDVNTSTRYDAAVTYIRDRRWALIPLHHVLPSGACSCRFAATDADHQAGGKSVGKHPITRGWQSGPPMSLADAFAIWGDESPDANIGIRTGTPSGIFVLDVDPDNGGDTSWVAMIQDNAPPQATYTVRTGSGGIHKYFRLPHTFRITNGANRLLVQKYGPGLDIRGEGGQVVAAPSVSGKGAYTVLDDTEPVDAPGWLLELLQATVETMPVTESPVVEDLPMASDLSGREAERVQRYAENVLAQEEAEYLEAPPGTGNQALFTAACNMLEIAQSPWNTVTTAQVWERLERARLARRDMHPDGGGQDPQEFSATWESARARVLGQGRALPADPNAGIIFDPGLFLPEGAPQGPEVPHTREEATSLVDAMEAQLLDASDLAKLPAPKPLVHGLLDLDTGAWLIGAPGSFKSFVALDLAGHVGTGRDWQGHRVSQGEVIYLAAEGARGMTLRTRAWEQVNGPMTGVKFLPLPLQYAGEKVGGQLRASVEWETLMALVRRRQPSMVVIDTQARVTAGMDENSNGDMGGFARAITLMQAAAGGACVLVVHHTGRSGGDARGASAIDGAQDTELKVERTEPRSALAVKLLQDKQKDQADSTEAIQLQLKVIDLGEDPETGRALSSLVVGERDPFTRVQVQPWVAELDENKRHILEVLREHGGLTMGLTRAEIKAILKERGWDLPKTSYYRALEALQALDNAGEPLMVQSGGERWVVNPVAYEVQSQAS